MQVSERRSPHGRVASTDARRGRGEGPRRMSIRLRFLSLAASVVVVLVAGSGGVRAAEVDCTPCHDPFPRQKEFHSKLATGCSVCHNALDASVVPHKLTGKAAKGVAPKQAELCLGSCHQKKDFQGEVTHAPAKTEKCMTCHDPHAVDQPGMLARNASLICLECHDDVKARPHLVVGFTSAGHPLGDEKRSKPVADPLRKGRPFSCVSCHEPHRSEFASLSRVDPQAGMELCQKCHHK